MKEYSYRKNEPSYTIYVNHAECTDCMDAYILKGLILIPNSLRDYFGDTLKSKDIILKGFFPFDKIDNTSFFFKASSIFKIRGKIIAVDSNNAIGKAPVFYVEDWEEIGKK